MLKIIFLTLMFQFCIGSIIKRSSESFVLKNATQTESPWLVLIKFKSKPLRCGGNLINDKYIVTAAHCFDDIPLNAQTLKKEVTVILGEWKTDKDPDCEELDDSCERVAEIPAKKVYIHQDYSKSSNRYKHKSDIALIQLAWGPRKSELIDSIDLTENECESDYDEEELTVTGFGHTPTSGNEYAKIKKSINMLMQSDEYCGNNLKTAFVRKYNICGIGTEGETTCSGDSGSGLTSNNNGVIRLEGIVAYGVTTCKDRDKPSGFVKVSCYKDWIDEKIRESSKTKKRN